MVPRANNVSLLAEGAQRHLVLGRLVREEGELASGAEEARGALDSLEELRHLVVDEDAEGEERFGRYVAPASCKISQNGYKRHKLLQ